MRILNSVNLLQTKTKAGWFQLVLLFFHIGSLQAQSMYSKIQTDVEMQEKRSLDMKILKKYLVQAKSIDVYFREPPIQIIADLKLDDNSKLLNFVKSYINSEFIPFTHFSSWTPNEDTALLSENNTEHWQLFGLSPSFSLTSDGSDPTFRTKLPVNTFLAHHKLQIIQLSSSSPNYVEKTLKFCEKIRLFASPHRDRFIFIGKTKELLQLFKGPVMMDFNFKFGVSDTGEIFRDPLLFQQGSIELLSPPPELDEKKLEQFLSQVPDLANKNVHLLNGRVLKIAAAPIPPYITFSQDGEISGGTHFIMLTDIGQKYNYTMLIDHESVKGTGVFRDGKWSGMTGAVYYRYADIGIMMGGTVERYGVIDFITFQPDSVLFITRTPKYQVRWQAIFYPYTPLTWLALLISYVAVTITLYFQLDFAKEKKKVFNAIFIPYQITLDQGFDIPIPISVKFLCGLFMFFTIVISTGYRSDLISYYSVPKEEKIPRDFETLDFRKDYTVVFNYHAGTAFQYFDSAKSGVIKNVRQRFNCEPNTAKCAIRAALDPHSVCITWGLVIRPIIAANLTLPGNFELKIVFSKPAVTFPIGFCFTKNSIFTQTFEKITGLFRDAGLVHRLNHNVYYNFSVGGKNYMKTQKNIPGSAYHLMNNKRKENEETLGLRMKNLTAVFVGLCMGLMISFVFYCVELCSYCLSSKGKKQLTVEVEPEIQENRLTGISTR